MENQIHLEQVGQTTNALPISRPHEKAKIII
jgi:hypothetical protein